MPKPRVIIEAPSILGLKPSGVQHLPKALRKAGLHKAVLPRKTIHVKPPAYRAIRDLKTGLKNPIAIRNYSFQLANHVQREIQRKNFPILLGGDCSVLLGPLLALRRLGRYGLFYLDGHASYYSPKTSPTGEVADMDLRLATGKGPAVLSKIGGNALVRESDAVNFGFRDHQDFLADQSPDIRNSKILSLDWPHIQKNGIEQALKRGVLRATQKGLRGFWIHLDADVLSDRSMPAVDYRLKKGGLNFVQLTRVLRELHATKKAVGISVTIFNPKLDLSGKFAQKLARCIQDGLK